jgi:hypothetical protein
MPWSPYKERVIEYVRQHPGCSKWDVAEHCTFNSRRCPSKQYYIVNTALRNGWIVGVWRGNRWELFVRLEPGYAEKIVNQFFQQKGEVS